MHRKVHYLLTLLLAVAILLGAAPRSAADTSPEAELAGTVYRYLRTLPRHSTDAEETAEARDHRMQAVAHEIALAAYKGPLAGFEPIDQAAASVVIGKRESQFARYVGERRCTEGPPGQQCDIDRDGKPRADSYWQLWQVACPKTWELPAGSREALRAAAQCASDRFRGALSRCRANGVEGVKGGFAGYRSSDCWWKGGQTRAADWEKTRARLRFLAAAP